MVCLSGIANAIEVRFESTQETDQSKPFTTVVQSESLPNETVGALTVRVLKENDIKFEGDDKQILSIQKVAVKSILLDNGTLRGFGWCYLVDGKDPGVAAGAAPLTADTKQLLWFYGYLEFKNKAWSTVCTPVAALK